MSLSQENHQSPIIPVTTTPPFRFSGPHPLVPIESLGELRQVVLALSTTRCPKWRFRFGDDCVVQLQPRPKDILFKGIVLQGAYLPSTVFRHPPLEGMVRVKFSISEGGLPLQWWVKPEHPRGRQRWHMEVPKALLARTLLELPRLARLTPALMLEAACLNCGKKLTDPVSQARWLGPECAHTSALDAVRVWRIPAEEAA
jgi:hypothetical protein